MLSLVVFGGGPGGGGANLDSVRGGGVFLLHLLGQLPSLHSKLRADVDSWLLLSCSFVSINVSMVSLSDAGFSAIVHLNGMTGALTTVFEFADEIVLRKFGWRCG